MAEPKNMVAARFILHSQSALWGPAYSGRETLHSDGSLLIHGVTQKDGGLYTLRILRIDIGSEDVRVQLQVDTFFWKCGRLDSSVQPTIKSVPPKVAEGRSVLLLIRNPPENMVQFVWFKGMVDSRNLLAMWNTTDRKPTVWGPAYSGRETLHSDGSLLIRRVTQKDRGLYTLRILRTDTGSEEATAQLQVDTSLFMPWHLCTTAHVTVESVPPLVAEGDDILFLVHDLPENLIVFAWFKGLTNSTQDIALYILHNNLSQPGPAHSGRETIYRNGSLLFEKVTRKDTGFYTLKTYNRYRQMVSTTTMYLNVHASFSVFCNTLPSSRLTIQTVPPYAFEGEDILLQVHNLPEDLLTFSWYKSEYATSVLKIIEYTRSTNSISWGADHQRRGMVYSNGSLVLQHVTEKDAGMYTLEILKKDFTVEKENVEFHVKKHVTQPFVQVTDTTVAGHRSVIFTCVSPDTDVFIRWIFNKENLQLTERITLSPTKCGLRIAPVGIEDAGDYQCEVSNGFSLKTSPPVSWP
ncbi:Carcinoembryonic antigen-related cell adhesion molecule 5 [Cricetulus griseus]|uniref:Carcinoembryonic antigen-related cell adhesion molecule 5 n=1 Tax=Cricetulus griseus TaxID=10029 RepID=G3IAF1_CRIGR|nr:Carcinoembryonic antigen-related cell adhesion molecule 5 [Cricetulus griseus]